jgi:16S rRNA (uracil1498-N3)-methyltransferase
VTAPVFVVPTEALAGAAAGAPVRLEGPEGRHAVAVRRLAVGEPIVLTDGQGAGVAGTVAAVEAKDALTVEVSSVLAEPEPRPRITVVQALPKGDRGELAVETMTEVGVDAVVPWAAARCVTQWKGERGARSLAKWRATAREAGKQARRLRFPEVGELMTTRQVCELLAGAGLPAVLHEEGAEPLAAAPLPSDGEIVLVVGPEGGIAPEEIDAFAAAGAKPYRLGPTVLRTSTAGVAAGALLLARSGRWG